jgi:FG-GAP-like repeat/PA14 domain/Secretion system C-terminal sorting domain
MTPNRSLSIPTTGKILKKFILLVTLFFSYHIVDAQFNAGSFAPYQQLAQGNFPVSICTPDIDGDGKPDVAYVDYGNKTLSILLNTGGGGTVAFAPKLDFSAAASPGSVAAADIDGDGKKDLIVASDISQTVSVFRNTSTPGSISFAPRADFTTGTYAVSVAAGDLNNDGKPDLAVTNNQQGTISVFRNTSTIGSISFDPKVDFSINAAPAGVVISDLDQDGLPDIAASNQFSNNVSVLLNASTGGSIAFAGKVDLPTEIQPYILSAGDLDGDGKTDLVAACLTNGKISVLKNNSTPGIVSFAPKVDYTIGVSPNMVAISDLDGDSKPDLAVSSSELYVSVLRNTSTPGNISLDPPVGYNVDASSHFVAVADVNGDVLPDLVVANGNRVSLLKNAANDPKVSVNILFPFDGFTLEAGTTTVILSDATTVAGTITKVAYYNGATKVDEGTTPPYLIVLNEMEPGNYAFTARAFNSLGDSAVSDTVHVTVTACTGSGSISVEGYKHIPGSKVSDLTGNAAFPDSPSIVTTINKFEYGVNLGHNYGARTSGYICVPQTGWYRFAIASDDQSELWLSTDAFPFNKRKIAFVNHAVLPRFYYVYSSQLSDSIHLIKGARYYIETLHKEGLGLDHLSVAWRLPNGHIEAPIPGSRLSPYIASSARTSVNDFERTMEPDQIEEVVNGLKVSVSPNPSYSDFTIFTKSNSEKPVSVTVTDVLGRVVESRTNMPANSRLQLGGKLRAGIYFVQILQGDERQQLKLIKK